MPVQAQNYPLHFAVYCHNLPLVKLLLLHGAAVNCESWVCNLCIDIQKHALC